MVISFFVYFELIIVLPKMPHILKIRKIMEHQKNRAGRRPLPDHLKRCHIRARIPAWLKFWLQEHEFVMGRMIEESLISTYSPDEKETIKRFYETGEE